MSYAAEMRDTRTPERATDRIEVRLRPSERKLLDRAARATKLPLSTIIVNGALREAARLEREKAKSDGGD